GFVLRGRGDWSGLERVGAGWSALVQVGAGWGAGGAQNVKFCRVLSNVLVVGRLAIAPPYPLGGCCAPVTRGRDISDGNVRYSVKIADEILILSGSHWLQYVKRARACELLGEATSRNGPYPPWLDRGGGILSVAAVCGRWTV